MVALMRFKKHVFQKKVYIELADLGNLRGARKMPIDGSSFRKLVPSDRFL